MSDRFLIGLLFATIATFFLVACGGSGGSTPSPVSSPVTTAPTPVPLPESANLDVTSSDPLINPEVLGDDLDVDSNGTPSSISRNVLSASAASCTIVTPAKPLAII